MSKFKIEFVYWLEERKATIELEAGSRYDAIAQVYAQQADLVEIELAKQQTPTKTGLMILEAEQIK